MHTTKRLPPGDSADQAAATARVDWRPPMEGTEADLATVAAANNYWRDKE